MKSTNVESLRYLALDLWETEVSIDDPACKSQAALLQCAANFLYRVYEDCKSDHHTRGVVGEAVSELAKRKKANELPAAAETKRVPVRCNVTDALDSDDLRTLAIVLNNAAATLTDADGDRMRKVSKHLRRLWEQSMANDNVADCLDEHLGCMTLAGQVVQG
jgi:hypothetical protein